jgi:site-specific DNA-methyltransferase (adenine-specific)
MKWTNEIEVFNEDCMETMKRYPDNFFDLAICDPPYGININMNMGRKKGQRKKHKDKKWDNSIPDEKYFKELFRVSKNQIIWGGNYFPLPLTKAWIFWDKNVPKGVSFADGELAWTSYEKTLVKVTIPYSGFIGSEGKIHPTQKPRLLYEWLFQNYTQKGFKIIDTHLGSASIAVALDAVNKIEKLDLSLVAAEIDGDYFKSSFDRVKKETQWQSIF